ncbi:MAG: DinB family protein [Acidobacteria bacterium]|nr:DinB family protein [Acidobacteriota bacterium]
MYDRAKTERPAIEEAAAYYFLYIDQVPDGDIVRILRAQLDTARPLLASLADRRDFAYAPGKWTIREVLSHVNDTERLFASRAFWFARGFSDPLPSFDQEVALNNARASQTRWESHVEEFESIRISTISFFGNLPPSAWMARGVASGNEFSVRALAFIVAGHWAHHLELLRLRYSVQHVTDPS